MLRALALVVALLPSAALAWTHGTGSGPVTAACPYGTGALDNGCSGSPASGAFQDQAAFTTWNQSGQAYISGNFTASIVNNVMTVTAFTSTGVAAGIQVPNTIVGAGVPAGTWVDTITSGTGGVGTYHLTNANQTVNVASEAMTSLIRPNWNVACVDYKCGASQAVINCAAGVDATCDPTIHNWSGTNCAYQPTGGSNSTPRIQCNLSVTSGVDIEGMNFGLYNGVNLNLSSNSCPLTLKNNYFQGGTNLTYTNATMFGVAAITCTKVDAENNTFNGNANYPSIASFSAWSDASVGISGTTNNKTFKYNAFTNLPENITLSVNSTYSTVAAQYNYLRNWVVDSGFTTSVVHGAFMQYGGSSTASAQNDINYSGNTIIAPINQVGNTVPISILGSTVLQTIRNGTISNNTIINNAGAQVVAAGPFTTATLAITLTAPCPFIVTHNTSQPVRDITLNKVIGSISNGSSCSGSTLTMTAPSLFNSAGANDVLGVNSSSASAVARPQQLGGVTGNLTITNNYSDPTGALSCFSVGSQLGSGNLTISDTGAADSIPGSVMTINSVTNGYVTLGTYINTGGAYATWPQITSGTNGGTTGNYGMTWPGAPAYFNAANGNSQGIVVSGGQTISGNINMLDGSTMTIDGPSWNGPAAVCHLFPQ